MLNYYQFIQATTFITFYIDIYQPIVTWDEFKLVGSKEVDGLDALSFKDTDVVSQMSSDEKEEIARKLVPFDGWEHYLDHFVKDEERKKELKTNISNQADQKVKQNGGSPSEKLKELICQLFPNYTMEKFFNACKKCRYNDTLVDLNEICTRVLGNK